MYLKRYSSKINPIYLEIVPYEDCCASLSLAKSGAVGNSKNRGRTADGLKMFCCIFIKKVKIVLQGK
jgi:hypothetical protein